MRHSNKRSFLKSAILILLIAAAAVTLPACGEKTPSAETESSITQQVEITITVEVVGPDGTAKEYAVTTDSDNLEGALLDSGFVSGEEGPYGLYIKTVCGITADYDTDGAYWSILKNGEYLMTGAGDTPIEADEHYELVYTKG